MIRPGIVWRIFRRELLDTLRDWNMLCIVIVVPFVLMPLTLVTIVETSWQSEAETREALSGEPGKKKPGETEYKVGLVGPRVGEFREKVAADQRLTVVELPDIAEKEPEDLRRMVNEKRSAEGKAYRREVAAKIADGTVDAVLVCGESKSADPKNFWVVVLSDETQTRSKKAGALLQKVTDGWRKEYRAERLKERGETEETLRPLTVLSEELAPMGRKLVYFFASSAPAIFFLLLLTGCFYAAVQAIPGEKERGTLATILSAPIRPIELLLGKWMNVMAIGIAGALSNTGSLLLTGVVLMSTMSKRVKSTTGGEDVMGQFFSELGLTWATIPWGGLGLLAVTLIFLTMVFSAISLVVCMFARGTSDSSYLLTPSIVVLCVPAAMASFPAMEWSLRTALIPLLNNAVLIREIFRQGVPDAWLVLVAFGSCGVFSLGVLFFGAKIFETEGVRFASPGGRGGLLKRPVAGRMSSGVSGLAALLVLGGALYLSLAGAGLGVKGQALMMQGWLLAVPVLMVWYLRLPWRESLGWLGVKGRVWPGVVGVGLTAWAMAVPFAVFFPMPEELAKTFYEVLKGLVSGPGGVVVGLLMLAVLPAVCEEVAFRGFIQTGLQKRFSPGVAFVLTSLCFGLAHMSVYRFLPTFILGLVLCWVRWRTGSLFPGMVIHGLNNGLVVLTVAASPTMKLTPEMPPWPMLTGGLVVFALGVAWIRKTTQAKT